MPPLSSLSLLSSPLSPGIHAPTSTDGRLSAKVRRAAQDFEAVLIQSLLEPVEKSFSALPGADDLSGEGNYRYLGTQALASALSRSGGVGLAAMMVRNLLKPGNLAAKAPGLMADKIK